MKLSKILNVSTIDSLVRFLNVLTGQTVFWRYTYGFEECP